MAREQRPAPALPPHPVLGRFYEDEKHRLRFVRDIFDETAPHYDRINAILSFGSGRWYRGDALKRAGLAPGMRALDVAIGTGGVAAAACGIVGPEGRVVGIDPSAGMLRQARAAVPIPLLQGVAEALPFRDGAFDFLSMGYALRHVADLERTFGEYRRVLKPGGTLMLLEFRRPRTRAGLALSRLYMGRVVPALSRIFTGSRPSKLLMQYCWETVENCVPPAAIRGALERAGFTRFRQKDLFGFLTEYVAARA